MKTAHKFLIVSLTFLMGCSVGATNWNDDIDAESRAQIKTLDEQIIKALHENNPQNLQNIVSGQLKEIIGSGLDSLVEKGHYLFRSQNYSLLDEYMSKNSGIGTIATFSKELSGEYDYKINFKVVCKETYLSLMLIENMSRTFLLTCIYGKYDGVWKLNLIKIGEYAYFKKNAVDFYNQAKLNYEEGNLIDAADDMEMFGKTASPAGEIFQYQKDQEMKTFATTVFNEANKKFHMPVKVSLVNTEPQVFNIGPIPIDEGIFPMVSYISKINLKDTFALKKENEELKNVIGNVFPGIEKGKKYVFFQAYNETSTGEISLEHYGFVLVTSEQ